MSIYVIADLHLSTHRNTNKSMEVFGNRWSQYMDKLTARWSRMVLPSDTVVIPGDISWALRLDEAISDLRWLDALPGQKLIGKGNHDFWWATVQKMTALLEKEGLHTLRFLYNNAYLTEGKILCGTRGWFLDEKQQQTAGAVDYTRMIQREVTRLRLSLDAAAHLQAQQASEGRPRPPILVFLHFPPVWQDFVCREFVALLHQYQVEACYFGHIHGGYTVPRHFSFEGIPFTLASSDFLDFYPELVHHSCTAGADTHPSGH